MAIRPCDDPELPLRLELPSSQTLEVREAVLGDVDRLIALYDGLDDTARYRRFFSLVRPQRRFYEHLVAGPERGAGCVIVVDVTDGADGRIVAEADWEPLGNGNAEMAMTIDAAWRGWLGPYLLGVLCRLAAERGIGNLEASILTSNRPMRSLTRARGEAVLPGSDWQTARIVFSTTGSMPDWAETELPKVLVEMRSGPWDVLADLADAGYEVLACTGPAAKPAGCPLLTEGACPLADHADAIVVVLPPDPARGDLLARHTARSDVPVEVVERLAHSPLDAERLLAAVDAALMRRVRRGGDDQRDPRADAT